MTSEVIREENKGSIKLVNCLWHFPFVTGFKAGAGGTVYYTDTNQGLTHRPVLINEANHTVFGEGFTKLTVDNVDRNPDIATIIINENSSYYEVDELEMKNHGLLHIHGNNSSFVVHNFTGDRTGLVQLRPGQKMFVQVVESKTGYSVAPVSYKIDQGAEIVFPSSLTLLGTRCFFEGLVVGVHRLIVAEGADVVFASTTQTGIKENEKFRFLTTPGNITFAEVYVQKGSRLEFSRINNTLVFTAIIFRLKYHALVNINHGEIDSSWAWVESEGRLVLDHIGHPAEMGPGSGTTKNLIGSGAGHGGEGGVHQAGQLGGEPYGSIYRAVHLGSGGGNGQGRGGSGGGMLHWRIGQEIELDGLVTLRGGNGSGVNAGGGSGGSILIETTNFTGYGEINVMGGDGSSPSGSGGSGGRISAHVRFRHKYAGVYKAYGGEGKTNAAAGTVYVEETARGPQYADLKYDKSTNTTYVTATHRYMEVDNEDRKTEMSSMMLESEHLFYELDELFLTRQANLQVRHPPGSPNVTVIIHRFLGDGSGRFHARVNQTIYVEVVESETNETTAPCSYKIDQGAEVVFPAVVNIYGTRSIIEGRITGVEHLIIASQGFVEFSSTAQTARVENRRYVEIDEKGNFSFATVTVERNSKLTFSRILNYTLSLRCSEFRIKYEGLMTMNHGYIYSAFAWIESEGILSLDGTGFGPEEGVGHGTTQNNVGSGAGHGGEGGKTDHGEGGIPYDSVYTPRMYGSGGGNGQGVGGSGGGSMFWIVGQRLQINGLLSSKGTDGTGTNAGGGSGGSILITTTNMTGHGEISVPGGSGTGSGSGGSGGRVGIHCRWRYKYGGKFTDHGGQQGRYGGPAGTIYNEENFRPLEYRHLKYMKETNTTMLAVDHTYVHIDNDGHDVPGATVLMEENTTYYEFDEMELTGHSRLLVYHPGNVTVIAVVHKFIGDKSGQFHIRRDQKIFVEYIESETNKTEAPCSYRIDVGGEIILPSEFSMHGTRSIFEGMIVGVRDLFVSFGATADFYSTVQTALTENNNYIAISEPGNISFAVVIVKKGGDIEFRKNTGFLRINVDELKIKYQGKLNMNHGKVFSTFAWLDSQGHFNLDEGGNPAEKGPGAGRSTAIGTGAGHGGKGAREGGQAYGSVYRPLVLGSGGGNGGGTGGSGGGQLLWEVGKRLELNGLISAKGGKGDGGNAGGGSGGSILIKTTNMTGHGEIAVTGGSSYNHGAGGGGSGGRVGIHCRWRYTYGGKFTDRGGFGTQNDYGAPAGTVYKEENVRPLEYRILKYSKETNTTYLAVDHTYLHVDNEGHDVPEATVLMEEGTTYYEFDEVELTGYSRLIVYHPNETQVTVIAHRFIGDKTGQFHLRINQTIYVEVVESETNKTEAPCSYRIDKGAEIVLPAEFHVHGVRSELYGLMTGVHFLFLEDGATLKIASSAQTAITENRTYVDITRPGNCSFAHVIIKQGGLLDLVRVQEVLVSVTSSVFEVLHKGTVKVNHGIFYSTFAEVETKGEVLLDGAGHQAATGPGAGSTSVNSAGSGGGFGGRGGQSYNNHHGGGAYGSVYRPLSRGSGGGHGQLNGGGAGEFHLGFHFSKQVSDLNVID